MTNSHKWAVWIAASAIGFLVLAFLGETALLAAIAYFMARIALIGGGFALIGLTLRRSN